MIIKGRTIHRNGGDYKLHLMVSEFGRIISETVELVISFRFSSYKAKDPFVGCWQISKLSFFIMHLISPQKLYLLKSKKLLIPLCFYSIL